MLEALLQLLSKELAEGRTHEETAEECTVLLGQLLCESCVTKRLRNSPPALGHLISLLIEQRTPTSLRVLRSALESGNVDVVSFFLPGVATGLGAVIQQALLPAAVRVQ